MEGRWYEDTHGGTPCEEEGRYWSDAPISKEAPEISNLQNCKTIHICHLSHPVCDTCDNSLKTPIQVDWDSHYFYYNIKLNLLVNRQILKY